MDDYEAAKRKAKEFYKTIGRVWCPALGDTVRFTAVGFQHIMRKRGKRRQRDEQKRRFGLLRYAVFILADPDALFIRREKVEQKFVKSFEPKRLFATNARFWSFKQIVDELPVTVLVRQLGNGEKHFFSIY